VKRGQEVEITTSEDIFGNDSLGLRAIYLKSNPDTKKCLLYIPKLKEWCELEPECFKVISPGRISKKNKQFISRVVTLGETTGSTP